MPPKWRKIRSGRYQECATVSTATVPDNLLVEMGAGSQPEDSADGGQFLFSKVTVEDNGQFRFHSGHSQPGSYMLSCSRRWTR